MNSELTELVPVFTTRPAFPTSVKKVNTSFKNVWRTWGPALPKLLADLMIFCPLGPMNFKNSGIHPGTSCIEIDNWLDFMTEFSRYCAYITQLPQTIGFLPRFYRAPLLIGFGRGRPWKTKLWNIIRLSLCKLEIILRLLLTLCFLIFVKSIQFSTVCSLLFNNTCDTSYSCISGWNTSLPNLSYNLWRSIYCHNI
jgi:hypothetical protein